MIPTNIQIDSFKHISPIPFFDHHHLLVLNLLHIPISTQDHCAILLVEPYSAFQQATPRAPLIVCRVPTMDADNVAQVT